MANGVMPTIGGVWDAAPEDGRRVMWENVMPKGMQHVDLVGHLKRALKKRVRKAVSPGNIAETTENALLADRLG